MVYEFTFDQINEATNNFSKRNFLNEGGEGKVYKGEIQIGTDETKTTVAMKDLNLHVPSEEFEKEIGLLKGLHHANLVALHGFCRENGKRILVYEYIHKGNLREKLYKKPCLTWIQRLNICCGAARGLDHLHSGTSTKHTIIHRDIKPENILLDEDLNAKVSDFGISKKGTLDEQQMTVAIQTRVAGTIGYFAPEIKFSGEFTKRTDVFAFGVVLFEVLCKRKPPLPKAFRSFDGDEDEMDDETIAEKARRYLDPDLNEDINTSSIEIFIGITARCLSDEPSDRPTMSKVVSKLEKAKQDLKNRLPKAMSLPPSSSKPEISLHNQSSLPISADHATSTLSTKPPSSTKVTSNIRPSAPPVTPMAAFDPTKKKKKKNIIVQDISNDAVDRISDKTENLSISDGIENAFVGLKKKKKKPIRLNEQSLSVQITREFDRQTERVKSLDLHPTEPWILLALFSGTLSIWNYQTKAIKMSFKISSSPVRSAKFIANKQWIVAGSDDKLIRVYNYNTSRKVKKFVAHEDYIRFVAVHPSCPFVLSASDDMLIKLWDWEKDWECSQIFEGHSHYVMQVAFNPKETNTFASASLDRTIKVWNIDSPNSHLTLEGHSDGVNCLEFHSFGDKSYLISGSDDLTAKVWEYQEGAHCVQTLEGHTGNITGICVHSEIPIVITSSEDNSIRVWDAKTYRFEYEWINDRGRVWAVGCMKKSSQIVIGCDTGVIVGKIICSD